ncbi:ABC transporter ATP-binding protein [archaeon]|jgi:ABC-2 type transport system ATP-binding protein|nr:ABC transporter ATP-binding protein [archaeon]
MDNTILKIEDAKKGYGTKIVLNGINLNINQGEIFGIIGPSGSGKTTFLKTIIGFVSPDEGDILFRDDHLLELGKEVQFRSVFKHPKDIKKLFGFSSQLPSFYTKLTVKENLDYMGSLYGLSKDARNTNIETLLKIMELSDSRDTLAKNLSGGMQRRLDIACALVHDPNILILDEPTSDLDPVLSRHIWELLNKINKSGKTIILASHHLSDMESFCTRIGILYEGKLAHVGSIKNMINKLSKSHEIHIETFPGNYDRIMEKVNNKLIIDKENRGHTLVIHTKKPEDVLLDILKNLHELNEILMDVKIARLTLDDVFSAITKKK